MRTMSDEQRADAWRSWLRAYAPIVAMSRQGLPSSASNDDRQNWSAQIRETRQTRRDFERAVGRGDAQTSRNLVARVAAQSRTWSSIARRAGHTFWADYRREQNEWLVGALSELNRAYEQSRRVASSASDAAVSIAQSPVLLLMAAGAAAALYLSRGR